MSGAIHPEELRSAAVADYHNSGDTLVVVAKRHGVSRSALHVWVMRGGPNQEDDLGYDGGWYLRGGVRYPLAPERRTA